MTVVVVGLVTAMTIGGKMTPPRRWIKTPGRGMGQKEEGEEEEEEEEGEAGGGGCTTSTAAAGWRWKAGATRTEGVGSRELPVIERSEVCQMRRQSRQLQSQLPLQLLRWLLCQPLLLLGIVVGGWWGEKWRWHHASHRHGGTIRATNATHATHATHAGAAGLDLKLKGVLHLLPDLKCT